MLGRQHHHRTTDMLTSKWRDMRLKCHRFQRYFNDVHTDFWDTEDEQLEEAHPGYLREEGHLFTYMESWVILKSHRDLFNNLGS
jgi:hypothetical protein